ncbi:LysM peptidoglycan-binding domain-containing protein [Sulfurovum sp. XGS-02]|uniref:3D domain-containing protein n=1 Tax=Sulfurovum sp. XGS-02 TaxID=2925411 RepID=UPI00204D56BF|nr:3D domain-containing protein [Sulfurovum sp. XGS-02]UPT78073.1 LysM peptidoglycan-binding domain-containing protein [Sulfurovum sp. XGS-02]
MSRNHLRFFLLSYLCLETAAAKSMIDCRVITGGMTECNPYGAKFLKAKEIVYDGNRQKLIRAKTLPVPEKKRFIKVVSVEDMIERHVKVQESVRFKGSEKVPTEHTTTEEAVAQVILDDKIEEIETSEVPPRIERELVETIAPDVPEKPQIIYGKYSVVSGDALSKIAKKFGLRTKEIAKMNGISIQSPLRIGQKLKLPFEQKMIDAISSCIYIIEKGDTIISIAKKFKLEPKELMQFNGIKRKATIHIGKTLRLPLPHIFIKTTKKLRVTATAYTSHVGQTDRTPFLAAWNNRLRPGMKIIAVSRDMLTRYGMRNGTKVRIGGLPGYYTVRDKMNKRYQKRIDIYMGLDKRRALRWGRRSVVVYW